MARTAKTRAPAIRDGYQVYARLPHNRAAVLIRVADEEEMTVAAVVRLVLENFIAEVDQ